jgi:hypothetical protein
MALVDAEGIFSSSDMIGVHWIESTQGPGRLVHLPVSGGEPCEVFADEVISVGKGKAKRDLHSVTVQLSDGQEARACAGGRVLQTLVTSKAGIRESVSPRSACVHMDHGGGLEVFYAGLDPGSVKWTVGDVIAAGSVLGTVGVKSVTSSRKLLLATEGTATGPLKFIEGNSDVNASVRLTSKNDPASGPANGLVFGSDSRLAPTAFAPNGVTLGPESSTPASTYHVGTRYLIKGTTAVPSGTVELVVRRGTSTRSKVLAKTVALESGAFELEFVLPESLKNEPYRYALTSSASQSKAAGAPAVWRPLLAIR